MSSLTGSQTVCKLSTHPIPQKGAQSLKALTPPDVLIADWNREKEINAWHPRLSYQKSKWALSGRDFRCNNYCSKCICVHEHMCARVRLLVSGPVRSLRSRVSRLDDSLREQSEYMNWKDGRQGVGGNRRWGAPVAMRRALGVVRKSCILVPCARTNITLYVAGM